MKYTELGSSDLNVSRVCMGCMGFGDASNGQHSWTIDEEHSREIIKNGLENGINFYDTAIGYQNGTSEQYVGRAVRDLAKRDDVVIATKFVPRSNEEIESGITGQQHIENLLDRSLKNLGMDYIDLYIYHMWDYRTPLYDIMEGLNNAVKAGKVRYIGISNCYAYQLAKANALAEKYGFAKFISVQNHYNLIFREEEREMAKLCAEDNISMTPYSALASGRLSRLNASGSKRLAEDSYAKEIWTEEVTDEKSAHANSMVFPIGAPNDAYAQYFIGQSYLAPLSTEQVGIFNVTFEPKCRNNWHIHNADKGGGQILVCVAGRGYYQEWGKPAQELHAGDTVNIPAGVKHWHGAAPDSWFSHLAIEVPGENGSTEWLEAVSDEEYDKLK